MTSPSQWEQAVPAKSIRELVEWLKANPSQGTYGSPAAGSLPHFFGVLFGQKAALDLRHVAYKGSNPAVADLIGGHLPIYVSSVEALVETHNAGRIRILATSGQDRYFALPDVPTFIESGFDIRGSGWFGMYAPANTPPEIVARLNSAVVAAVRSQDITDKLAKIRLEANWYDTIGICPNTEGRLRALGGHHQGVRLQARLTGSRDNSGPLSRSTGMNKAMDREVTLIVFYLFNALRIGRSASCRYQS